MANLKEPCTYCGTNEIARNRGHVLSKAIYPNTLTNADRIIVPECKECKALWEDAEPHFRNILITIWEPDKISKDDRFEKMARSFIKLDGEKRLKDVKALFEDVEFKSKPRKMIFPAKDPRFNLILRRIVRGLCHHHNLCSPIPDKQVECDAMPYLIPESFKPRFTWNCIAPDFFKYGYWFCNDDQLHSFWLLRFSKHIEFYGRVAAHQSK